MRLNDVPILGFTYASGTASSVSTIDAMGTDSRQKSSARSSGPSRAISAAVGIALVDVGSARSSAGSILRPSRPNSTIRYSVVPGLPSYRRPSSSTMNRSPLAATCSEPDRATVVASLPSSTECRKTLRIVPSNVLMLSTKTTRLARRNSRKSPGVSSAISSRDSSWRSYSSLRCSAQGDRNSDNTRIATKKGAANHRIGRRQSARPMPEREPDDHLAVAVPAHERQQHGDEHRDRNKNIEIKQRVEAKQREEPLRGDDAARGAPPAGAARDW